jgi:hypothetical protein
VAATIYPRLIGVPFHQIFRFLTSSEQLYPESLFDRINQELESIQQLLDHVEEMVTKTVATQNLDLQQPIRVASDSGAFPGRSSYGWIIQIGKTKVARERDQRMVMILAPFERKDMEWRAPWYIFTYYNNRQHSSGPSNPAME